MASIQDQLDDLRRDIGDATLGPTEGINDKDLPNGQACVLKSLYQLHVRMDELFGIDGKPGILAQMEARIAALEAKPVTPPVTTVPQVPAAPELQPDPSVTLSDAELKTLEDMNYRARKTLGLSQTVIDRLYSMNMGLTGNPPFADYNWRTFPQENLGELLGYIAQTDYYKNDAGNRAIVEKFAKARGVAIGSTAVQNAPSISGALLPAGGRTRGEFKQWTGAKDIVVYEPVPSTIPATRYLEGVTVIPKGGKLSVGGEAIDADAPIQVHGSGSAEILCSANEDGADPQNAKFRHTGVFKLANDGSMGMLQNAFYRRGQAVRTDLTRAVNALHFDSMGTLSLNRERYDGTDSRSQRLVIAFSEARRMWVLALPAAGEGLAIRRSQSTNDFGDIDNPNCAGGELVVVEPLPI